MSKKVVVIEGDDAAPEAMKPTVALIDSMNLGITWQYPLVGEPAEAEYGEPLPDETRKIIDQSDTVFFGSTSTSSRVALFYLRWGCDTYANVRPCKYRTGYQSPLKHPEDIDFVIVRENLEDLYVAAEGDNKDLAVLNMTSRTSRRPLSELGKGKFAIKAITEKGSERVTRFAFELARTRKKAGGKGKVTCATKHNMLPKTDGLFLEIFIKVAPDYPDIEFNNYIIDDFACRMISEPHAFDVVVMPNLYGDIMSDGAAGLVGGLGLAPSGCYGDNFAYFESAHGTAPDIMGQHIINPTACLISAAMMLEYLGFEEQSRKLDEAISQVYVAKKCLTPDQGGTAKTPEFCDAVASFL